MHSNSNCCLLLTDFIAILQEGCSQHVDVLIWQLQPRSNTTGQQLLMLWTTTCMRTRAPAWSSEAA
jgi:hypothetical protein